MASVLILGLILGLAGSPLWLNAILLGVLVIGGLLYVQKAQR